MGEGEVAPKVGSPDKLVVEEQSLINQDREDSQCVGTSSDGSGSKVEDSPAGDSKAASASHIGCEQWAEIKVSVDQEKYLGTAHSDISLCR